MNDQDLKAIAFAIQALNDWVVTYASDFAAEDELEQAGLRIRENGGTLSYATEAREGLQRVIANSKAA